MADSHIIPRSFRWSRCWPVGVAAAAMVATLPGRTHGLGLITEPLLADLGMERVSFAAMNFWATLIGAAFCIPVGWLIDRVGVRWVLAFVTTSLGAIVLAMTGIGPGTRTLDLPTPEIFFSRSLEWSAVSLELFVLVLLTRGFGQSALSVASLALIGKVSGSKPGLMIGIYSFLVALGFFGAFGGIKYAFDGLKLDWRTVWGGIGWTLFAAGVLMAIFVREPQPESSEAPNHSDATNTSERSFSMREALLSPGFWVFALATSFYGLVAAGMSLFNQSLLAERGFDRDVFLTITTLGPVVGLAANLLGGWLAIRLRLGVLLAVSMGVQGGALALFPMVTTLPQVYAYAVAMGIAGGLLTVIFFTVWRQAFGPKHLGQIQGAAQLLTVLASAAGPLVLAAGQRASGSYVPVVQYLAITAGVFALVAWFVPLPNAGISEKANQPS